MHWGGCWTLWLVKSLLAKSTSYIGRPGFESQFCFWFQPPVNVYPGRQQMVGQVAGSLPPTRKTWIESWLLALAWASPGCCGHLEGVWSGWWKLSLCLPFKLNEKLKERIVLTKTTTTTTTNKKTLMSSLFLEFQYLAFSGHGWSWVVKPQTRRGCHVEGLPRGATDGRCWTGLTPNRMSQPGPMTRGKHLVLWGVSYGALKMNQPLLLVEWSFFSQTPVPGFMYLSGFSGLPGFRQHLCGWGHTQQREKQLQE